MMQIQESGEEIIILNPRSNWLDESEQRMVVTWFKEHKPQILRDIMCEECPEHAVQVEAHNYFYNDREQGKHT